MLESSIYISLAAGGIEINRVTTEQCSRSILLFPLKKIKNKNQDGKQQLDTSSRLERNEGIKTTLDVSAGCKSILEKRKPEKDGGWGNGVAG